MSYVALFLELHQMMDTPVFKERPLGWAGWYALSLNLLKKHVDGLEFLGFYLPEEDHLQIGPYIGEYGMQPFLGLSQGVVGKALAGGEIERDEQQSRAGVPLKDREGKVQAVLYLHSCGEGLLDDTHKKNLSMLMAVLQDQLY